MLSDLVSLHAKHPNQMIGYIIAFGFLIVVVYQRKKRKKFQHKPIAPAWRTILQQRVHFYRQLNEEGKRQFENDVQEFLASIKITGVKTEITLVDKLLVASSAVIPLFGFPRCTYRNLEEVIIYPTSFNRWFQLDDPDERINGMVGSGVLEGKVLFSKPALHAGFDINDDQDNVGLHEFIHIFDKENGFIDGVPPGFEKRSFAIPWLQFIHQKIAEIEEQDSDIHVYATNSQQEFFAVAGEYFFESPHLLKAKHPILYRSLMKAFSIDTAAVLAK